MPAELHYKRGRGNPRSPGDILAPAAITFYVMGEGVADPGGIFGTTKGLVEEFGPDRIVEMPVAENGLTGIAIGSALMGMHPVMTHQRVDFALLCIEQLYNAAAKSSYVTGGRHKVPMTVRMIIGRGWGQGPQHSRKVSKPYLPTCRVSRW